MEKLCIYPCMDVYTLESRIIGGVGIIGGAGWGWKNRLGGFLVLIS